jgi:hypothetical protein
VAPALERGLMTWVKLDDQFTDHPKVVAAGPLAAWLYICGLTYAARYLTDGFIPAAQVRRLADLGEPERLAERLVGVELWEREEAGYRIHDYLDFNPSAAQVRKEREDNARRQEEWRRRRGEKPAPRTSRTARDAVSNGVTDAGDNPTSNGAVTAPRTRPVPGPVPVPAGSRPGPAGRAAVAAAGSAAPASAAAPSELVEFDRTLAGTSGYEPTAELFAKVLEKYAGLDLVEEAVKLRSYLREHPGELCSDRRVLNWLQGAQKRAAEVGKEDRGNGRPGTGRRNGYDPKAY